MSTPICLVGIGKIAVDQHVPSIAASPDWELAATVSRAGTVDGVQGFNDFDRMLAERQDISVISLCLPPVPRYAYAQKAIAAGRHVMLEKPPGATLAEVLALQAQAEASGISLFATWHSRMARAVSAAKAFLSDKDISGGKITWKEDVRRWHPGQDWVFEAGGMGVFDPGINALSILTEILPKPVHLEKAELYTPANRQTPIAADLSFSGGIMAAFDWLQTGPQTWEIEVDCGKDRLLLWEGGNQGSVNDEALPLSDKEEYPALYAHMAALVRSGTSDVDLAPMIHVCDAMALGHRHQTDPFEW